MPVPLPPLCPSMSTWDHLFRFRLSKPSLCTRPSQTLVGWTHPPEGLMAKLRSITMSPVQSRCDAHCTFLDLERFGTVCLGTCGLRRRYVTTAAAASDEDTSYCIQPEYPNRGFRSVYACLVLQHAPCPRRLFSTQSVPQRAFQPSSTTTAPLTLTHLTSTSVQAVRRSNQMPWRISPQCGKSSNGGTRSPVGYVVRPTSCHHKQLSQYVWWSCT